MRKLTAIMLVLLCCSIPLRVYAAPTDIIFRIIPANLQTTAPEMQTADIVGVNAPIRFLVNRDNFMWITSTWENSDGKLAVFTEEKCKDAGLLVDTTGTDLQYFGDFVFLVEHGELYITSTARAATEASQAATIAVAVKIGQTCSARTNVKIKIAGNDGGNGAGGTGAGEGDGTGTGEGDGNGIGTGEGDGNGTGTGEGDGNGTGTGEGDGNGTGTGEGDDNGGGTGEGDGNGTEEGDGGGDTTGDGGIGGTVPAVPTADGLKITGLREAFSLGDTVTEALGSSIEVKAGDTLFVPLPAQGFTWEGTDGEVVPAGGGVSLAQLEHVSVGMHETSANAVIRQAAIAERNGTAGIQVKLEETILSLDDVSFSCELWLCYQNETLPDGVAELRGLITRSVNYLSAGTGWHDLSDGVAVEPLETLRDVRLYLGEAMTMRTTLLRGERYCGIAVRETVFDAGTLQNVEAVYSLLAIGLEATGGALYLEYGAARDVFDADGVFLGTTAAALPYRDTYFVCGLSEQAASLPTLTGTVGGNSGSASDAAAGRATAYPDRFYEEAPAADGSVRPDNAYDNPSTGR